MLAARTGPHAWILALAAACGAGCGSGSGPQLSATAVDFGDVPLFVDEVSRELVLRAPSDSGLSIAAIELEPPFAHDLSSAPLVPGEERAFRISLVPRDLGTFATSLSITFAPFGQTLSVPIGGTVVCSPYVSPVFGKSTLHGASPPAPTALQFGPDGRLYVACLTGRIEVYRVVRNAKDDYSVVESEVIDLIRQIDNHDDLGQLDPSVANRLVTGILVAGSASAPLIYVASSDPRVGKGSGAGLDTNSGILSRLSWNGTSWARLDLVRGLPRSDEAHVNNGLALDAHGGTLYLATGGNTNMGAPSAAFDLLPEYALSGAILSVDLNAIGNATYDLPTLDDEDRPGNPDAGDPFGGNRGKNQARLLPGGPVQVHSPGWRTPYDLVLTESGRMYAFDNGPNSGWGLEPLACSNAPHEGPAGAAPDQLHHVPFPGFYAGHPNPTRASTANTFNASNPQSPISSANPVECQWLDPEKPVALGGDGSLTQIDSSTNGIAEYTAPNFGGALAGNLLVLSLDSVLRRIVLDPTGTVATLVEPLLSNAGPGTLDLTVQGALGELPGTIWLCDYVADEIVVLEPIDYENDCGVPCSGADSWVLDEDGDQYKNADELANGTNPCSSGDVPPDADGDHLSDLIDSDDDNDGANDKIDFFAVDPLNGRGTFPPLCYSWFGGDPGTGLLGLGFTGLMCNGITDYSKLFEPVLITAGGAAGVLTLENEARYGTATGSANQQFYGFQLGVTVHTSDNPYYVQTRVLGPYFDGHPPFDDQAQGLFAGTGGQDDYVRLVLARGAALGTLEVGVELAGSYNATFYAVDLLASSHVDLRLSVDPTTHSIQPRCSVVGAPFFHVGPPIFLPVGTPLDQSFFGPSPLAAGIMATAAVGFSFTAKWDDFQVRPGGP